MQFVLKHERRHDLHFVPRDSEFGKELRRRFHLEAVESMLWIEGDKAFIESDSTLHAAQYVGGIYAALARIGFLIPAALRNFAYRIVARNRKRISARMNVCLVPTAEQKLRFLS